MPLGTNHIKEGILQIEQGQLVLRPDGGGCWRLSADATAYQFVGRRVRVKGVRAGFDLLEVRSVERC
ncbi:DUF5818 domain-containing protein [Sphingosinicella sp. LY1275]|uniref:DUF5818 domain-containing protein n=1 Tax=Sphingosinicella sp. LY1275 TaxID=3095379 RepID=UPI002ADEB0A3|nr:DUF5818 domain-containing protein [Sphingosinicella sp. LY1275]MEA1015580.1 DUF5818 domain-containing protein [Sphingosinicella sp. LY1275]